MIRYPERLYVPSIATTLRTILLLDFLFALRIIHVHFELLSSLCDVAERVDVRIGQVDVLLIGCSIGA